MLCWRLIEKNMEHRKIQMQYLFYPLLENKTNLKVQTKNDFEIFDDEKTIGDI